METSPESQIALSGRGVLPYQHIKRMVEAGELQNIAPENVRPASLDLTLTSEIYRLDEMFLPRKGETIRDILRSVNATDHDPRSPMERNVLYLARLREQLHLPPHVWGSCNPKSSTGRVDIQVRVLADGVARYDTVSHGFHGELWLLMSPKSFPVKIKIGDSLSQLRFCDSDTARLTQEDLERVSAQSPFLWDRAGNPLPLIADDRSSDNDGTLIMNIDVTRDLVGWECLGLNRVLDLGMLSHYQPSDFFRPLHRTNGAIRLRNNAFYILYTRERLKIAPQLASEMIPMDERSGEFRTHYAGFFDPGWGWGKHGEAVGRSIVLEIRPFEDIVLRDDQPVGKVRFEYMAACPELSYDQMADSNYSIEAQTPKLSKHFVPQQ